MLIFIKKILGINDIENKLKQVDLIDNDINKIYSQIKIDADVINKKLEEYKEYSASKFHSIESKVNANIVSIKFKGWSSEQEFIELSTRVYVLDNGWRKENKPFVKIDENGREDKYDMVVGQESKMRCYMLKKLVLVGYGNLDDFIAKGAEKCDFEYFFGKSYRELISYMVEHNYEKLDEGICSLNFYEI